MTAAELLAVAYSALPSDERDDAFARICASRAREQAGDESQTERYLRSLQRAAAHADGQLSADEYRRIRRELASQGEEIEPLSRIIKHFTSWRMASEALMLSEHHVAGEIQRRFRARRVGKVWKYSEPTLRDTLERCVAHYGRIPQVAELSGGVTASSTRRWPRAMTTSICRLQRHTATAGRPGRTRYFTSATAASRLSAGWKLTPRPDSR